MKQLNHEDFEILIYKKPSFVEDCDYSTVVTNLWNTEISDEVELDKSIKKMINNVAIGQLVKGINKVQASCIFHTVEEAKGYQTLNGGTINIITKQDELATVEIVESYPKMNDNEDLDSGTHRLRQESVYHITDGLEHDKVIIGPKRKVRRRYNN